MTVDPKCSRRPALTRDKRPEQRICWYLMTFTAFVFVLLGVPVWDHIVASLEEAHREHIKAQEPSPFHSDRDWVFSVTRFKGAGDRRRRAIAMGQRLAHRDRSACFRRRIHAPQLEYPAAAKKLGVRGIWRRLRQAPLFSAPLRARGCRGKATPLPSLWPQQGRGPAKRRPAGCVLRGHAARLGGLDRVTAAAAIPLKREEFKPLAWRSWRDGP